MKAGQSDGLYDISMETLCLLNWHYFDGVWLEEWPSYPQMRSAMALCDSTGMWATASIPWLGEFGNILCNDSWARYFDAAISDSSAFIHTDTAGEAILDSLGPVRMDSMMAAWCDSLIKYEDGWETLWYYDIWNEAPAYQRRWMTDAAFAYDGYFPSVFTQDTSMAEVGTTSSWSWLTHVARDRGEDHPISITFSAMHRIGSWAGYQTKDYSLAPTFHTQANSVRAYMATQYLGFPLPSPPTPASNAPRILGYNAYPFRQVGTAWEDSLGCSSLGDELHTWMLEHYEEGLDSTIVVAALEDHLPVHYHPQAFGACGDTLVWGREAVSPPFPPDTIPVMDYHSYTYRLPSPSEFRMLCNDALMRQAKGIFPYSIRGYPEPPGKYYAGLLDEDLIPYDAPYEEWVYGERPTDDFYYAPPDSLPPFRPGFDPLFHLDGRPTTSGARAQQDYLEWKFAPYGRLWDSMRETLGEIAWMAPELSGLWWLEGTGHPDAVEIDWPDTCWAGPQCRIFTDGTETRYYLYYLNRCCRDSSHVFWLSACHDSLDFPSMYALDHSRRFIVPRETLDDQLFAFGDTLEAGQGRLLEFIPSHVDADLRITRPDITAGTGPVAPGHDFGFTVGDTVIVLAAVYNMGTEGAEEVPVSLTNTTEEIPVVIGRDTLSFDGLSLQGYETDEATAEFRWVPVVPGACRMRIDVASVPDEPDTLDNTTTALFLIEPRDYSTAVLDAPWDMTEATTSPPAWKTADVDSLWGYQTAFTDSIGGMFEGTVRSDSGTTNRLYLHTPGNGAIDGDTWDRFSLACHTGVDCAVILGWTDSRHGTGSVQVGTADEGWTILEPYDLQGSWSGKDISRLWLRFQPAGMGALPVRIGWVRLTEQEEGR